MNQNSLETCIRAWRGGDPVGQADGTAEARGDYYFCIGEFDKAIEAYEACTPAANAISAKLGWCLAANDRFTEARDHLTMETCGESSAERAMLAAIIAGGWEGHALFGGFGPKAQEVRARKKQVRELVANALLGDEPDGLAFYAYKELVSRDDDREAALSIAEKALERFDAPWLRQWHVMLLRTLERPSNGALDALLAATPDVPSASYAEEVLLNSLALSRFGDVTNVLAQFVSSMTAEDEPCVVAKHALILAYVEFRRALHEDRNVTASAAAVDSVLENLPSVQASTEQKNHLAIFAIKLRLAISVILEDADAIRASVTSLVNHSWSRDFESGSSPACEVMWLGGLVHEAEFGDGYLAPIVGRSLDAGERVNFELLIALHTVVYVDDTDQAARQTIISFGVQLAPPWAAGTVAETLFSEPDRDLLSVGEALVDHYHYVERTAGMDGELTLSDFDDLTADQLSELVDGIVGTLDDYPPEATGTGKLLLKHLGHVLFEKKGFDALLRLSDLVAERVPDHHSALFYAALARHELKQFAEAQSRYEHLLKLDSEFRSAYWNLVLIYEAQGHPVGIQALLPALEHRSGLDKEWQEAFDHAKASLPRALQSAATGNTRAFIQGELAAFPPLRHKPIDPSELTLLEAACLVALLRATDLDHTKWVLGPFKDHAIPFEPTDRFRGALLSLAWKGVLRIADTTPAAAFTTSSGSLRIHLAMAHWTISSHTLALNRNVRDLSRTDWPEHWEDESEILSRDLATEECIAYLEYLAEERGLEAPERTDARALFRELLEHCSAGQCWYYIHSGVQSANDYRTKYAVSKKQVTVMILKRTRQRGENAIANGWDTQYSRLRALPRSHLSAGLHDVLTGWGERAFDERIRQLSSARKGD